MTDTDVMDTTEKKKNSPVAGIHPDTAGVPKENNRRERKIDPRKLVIYSEIMKPKFDE